MTIGELRSNRIHNRIHQLSGHVCAGGNEVCAQMTELLDALEDERAHCEAVRIREEAEQTADAWTSEVNCAQAERSSGAMHYAASMIDPYELRDDRLVHKADGSPVTY